MSFVPHLLGMGSSSSGGSGMNYNAQGTDLAQPVTTTQTNQLYNQAQSGLSQQQNFLNALNFQNGVGNLGNVYSQYQNVANGTGPNPAQAALNQATQQNIQNQAAMMASQRGASQNAGLLARQAAVQGGNLQQQAASQGASLQAQQQLAALGQMGNIANAQVGYQGQALQGYNQAAQNEQQNLLNSLSQQNNAKVGMQSNINNANSGIAQTTAKGQQQVFSGVTGMIGGSLGMAQGGMVPSYAEGGPVSGFGNYLKNYQTDVGAPNQSATRMNPMNSLIAPEDAQDRANAQSMQSGLSSGRNIRSMFSGPQSQLGGNFGEELGGEMALAAAKGGMINAQKGKMISGKAKVKGDSYSNDTVPAMLSPGEVVIPRHVMQSNDPAGNAAKFVDAILRKNGGLKK